METPPNENLNRPVENVGSRPPLPVERAKPTGPVSAPVAKDTVSFAQLVDQAVHVLTIIRAKWYWGLLAAVIIGGSVGYKLMSIPHEYRAQTSLLAGNALDKVLGVEKVENETADSKRMENRMLNHVTAMTSRKFRTHLVDSFSDAEIASICLPYLKPGKEPSREMTIKLFQKMFNVEREKGRELFVIEASHRSKDVALLIVSRFSQIYIQQVQEEKRLANKEGLERLQRQVDTMRQQITQEDESLLEFKKQNDILPNVGDQGIWAERLRRLDGSITEIGISRVQLESKLEQAKKARKLDDPMQESSYLASYGDNQILRQDLSRFISQKSILSRTYGPNHPKMKDVEASIVGVRENINRNFNAAIGDLESQLSQAKRLHSQMKAEFDEAFAKSIETGKLAAQSNATAGGIDAMKQSLLEVQRRLGDATIANQLPGDILEVIDPPFLLVNSIPKKVIYAILTGMLTLAAFVLAPLAVNVFDKRIKSTSDLEQLLGLSLLGAIPKLKCRVEECPHIVRNRTDVGITESFVSLAGHLDLMTNSGYPKCVLVTSTLPGEGKSFVVSNLASTYTQIGKRTVVIDLDLRRPSQHRIHGVPNTHGLLSWARKGFDLMGLFTKDGSLHTETLPDGTTLVTAGGSDPQPSNYLVNKNLVSLIASARTHFDVVIIDSPPAGVFQDALVLARHADERVLITRVGKPPVPQLLRLISEFQRAGTPFTGAVLNGFDPNAAHRELAYLYNSTNYGYNEKSPEASS